LNIRIKNGFVPEEVSVIGNEAVYILWEESQLPDCVAMIAFVVEVWKLI